MVLLCPGLPKRRLRLGEPSAKSWSFWAWVRRASRVIFERRVSWRAEGLLKIEDKICHSGHLQNPMAYDGVREYLCEQRLPE